jgi:hypothetical protein
MTLPERQPFKTLGEIILTSIEMENRIAALEAFVADVVRAETFTVYAFGKGADEFRRTPLGNRGAALMGLPPYPTNGGLDTTLDSVS